MNLITDNRKSGFALLAGSLGALATMALHPHGSAQLSPEMASRLAFASGLAHSIAIAASLATFLGLCGLTARLRQTAPAIATRAHLPFAAIVTFGFACVAVLIATAVDGFTIPAIMRHMAQDMSGMSATPDTYRTYRIALDSIFQINQAFAAIYSIATATAIFLWSLAAARTGGLHRVTAVYGLVTQPLLSLLIAVGHLSLKHVHGMAVVVGIQALWFFLVAAELLSPKEPAHV